MSIHPDIRTTGMPVASYEYKLVDADTGEELILPALRRDYTGCHHWVENFKPSRFVGNPGYVYTRMNDVFVPSVVGAMIVVEVP